jgi:hypothetical protein
MRSSTPGASTSGAEIANIDRFGIWVLHESREYFLAFDEFPWFRKATLQQVLHVEVAGTGHLRWPELDVDLSLDSIRDPGSYPLVYR